MIEHSCSRARATQNATVSRIQWGEVDICFVEGRFRFGAALFPGFHYDVRPARGYWIARSTTAVALRVISGRKGESI